MNVQHEHYSILKIAETFEEKVNYFQECDPHVKTFYILNLNHDKTISYN